MSPHPFSTYDIWKLRSPDADLEDEWAALEKDEEDYEQSLIDEAHADPAADELDIDEEDGTP